jgi:hypothetical protein
MKNFSLIASLHILLLCLLVMSPAESQKLPAGPQVLTIFSNADDTEQPYGLYLPLNYDPQKNIRL